MKTEIKREGTGGRVKGGLVVNVGRERERRRGSLTGKIGEFSFYL
jgi:hypothetical protein